jgi:hypothetical protein
LMRVEHAGKVDILAALEDHRRGLAVPLRARVTRSGVG